MAKKNDGPGIYITREEQKKNRIHANEDPEGFAAALDAMAEAEKESATDVIGDVRSSLAISLTPFLDGPVDRQEAIRRLDDSKQIHTIDLGDGAKSYVIDSDVTEAALDVIDALRELQALDRQLQRDGGIDVARFLKSAMHLGRLCERIKVRPFEPLVKIGTRKVEKSRDGAFTTNAEFIKKQQEYQPAVDSKMAEGNSYTEATELVATMFYVSGRTVRNHTGNSDTAIGNR